MEDHASKPSNRIPALEKYLARWSTQTFPVKSAEQEHLGALRAAEDVLKGLSQNPADNIDEIIPCAARIQKLKARHEDAEGRKEREYQHNVWKQQEALLFELFNIFGHERTEQLYQSWCHRPGQSPTGSTGSDTITPYATDTTTSPSTPGPNQPKSKDESSSKNTRNQMPSPPNTESEDEPITQPTEPDKPERNSAVGLQKRPAEPPAARPTKRPRSNNTQGPLTGDKTIEFEQVYQKSHAESKHVIVKHDEFWYILECKEHRVRFNNVRGAMVHLTGKKHKDASVSFKGAIRTLGTRVLNCDADKASQNNDVTQRPTYSEMGRPVTDIPPPDGQSLSTRRKQSLTGIKPKPGEVYTTFWSEAKQFFAILVLPWRNVGQFGISFSLSVKDTKLIKNVPSCYCYNQNNELYELKPEYRLGGEHYSKREYPIMYFDAPVFPTDCQVDWVVAGDFDLYDPKDASIPFKEIVDGFIASRNSGGGAESGHDTLVQFKDNQGTLNTDARTSGTSTRQQSSSTRGIIAIDDERDDNTGDPHQWSDTSMKSGSPVVKIEPPDEAMTDVHDRQGTSTTYDNATPQQSLTAPAHSTPDHSEPCRGLPAPKLPTRDTPPNSSDTQSQTPNDGPIPKKGGDHELSPINDANYSPQTLSQPKLTAARVPEGIMAPSRPAKNSPPVPGPCDSSRMNPTPKPLRDAHTTKLHSHLKQLRNASSEFHVDSDGHLRWVAPKTPSGTKQKPMSARQYEELRARILPTGNQPEPAKHQASRMDPRQTTYVTPHGFKRSF